MLLHAAVLQASNSRGFLDTSPGRVLVSLLVSHY